MTIAVEHADAAPRFGGDKALRKRVMKWLNHHHHQPAAAEADAQPANTTAGAGHPRGSIDKQQSALSKTTSAANSAQSRKPQTGPISGPISVSATFTDAAVDLTQDQFSHDHDLLGNLGTMPEDEAGPLLPPIESPPPDLPKPNARKKAVNLWRKWKAAVGLSVHKSTASLNPNHHQQQQQQPQTYKKLSSGLLKRHHQQQQQQQLHCSIDSSCALYAAQQAAITAAAANCQPMHDALSDVGATMDSINARPLTPTAAAAAAAGFPNNMVDAFSSSFYDESPLQLYLPPSTIGNRLREQDAAAAAAATVKLSAKSLGEIEAAHEHDGAAAAAAWVAAAPAGRAAADGSALQAADKGGSISGSSGNLSPKTPVAESSLQLQGSNSSSGQLPSATQHSSKSPLPQQQQQQQRRRWFGGSSKDHSLLRKSPGAAAAAGPISPQGPSTPPRVAPRLAGTALTAYPAVTAELARSGIGRLLLPAAGSASWATAAAAAADRNATADGALVNCSSSNAFIKPGSRDMGVDGESLRHKYADGSSSNTCRVAKPVTAAAAPVSNARNRGNSPLLFSTPTMPVRGRYSNNGMSSSAHHQQTVAAAAAAAGSSTDVDFGGEVSSWLLRAALLEDELQGRAIDVQEELERLADKKTQLHRGLEASSSSSSRTVMNNNNGRQKAGVPDKHLTTMELSIIHNSIVRLTARAAALGSALSVLQGCQSVVGSSRRSKLNHDSKVAVLKLVMNEVVSKLPDEGLHEVDVCQGLPGLKHKKPDNSRLKGPDSHMLDQARPDNARLAAAGQQEIWNIADGRMHQSAAAGGNVGCTTTTAAAAVMDPKTAAAAATGNSYSTSGDIVCYDDHSSQQQQQRHEHEQQPWHRYDGAASSSDEDDDDDGADYDCDADDDVITTLSSVLSGGNRYTRRRSLSHEFKKAAGGGVLWGNGAFVISAPAAPWSASGYSGMTNPAAAAAAAAATLRSRQFATTPGHAAAISSSNSINRDPWSRIQQQQQRGGAVRRTYSASAAASITAAALNGSLKAAVGRYHPSALTAVHEVTEPSSTTDVRDLLLRCNKDDDKAAAPNDAAAAAAVSDHDHQPQQRSDHAAVCDLRSGVDASRDLTASSSSETCFSALSDFDEDQASMADRSEDKQHISNSDTAAAAGSSVSRPRSNARMFPASFAVTSSQTFDADDADDQPVPQQQKQQQQQGVAHAVSSPAAAAAAAAVTRSIPPVTATPRQSTVAYPDNLEHTAVHQLLSAQGKELHDITVGELLQALTAAIVQRHQQQ